MSTNRGGSQRALLSSTGWLFLLFFKIKSLLKKINLNKSSRRALKGKKPKEMRGKGLLKK